MACRSVKGSELLGKGYCGSGKGLGEGRNGYVYLRQKVFESKRSVGL